MQSGKIKHYNQSKGYGFIEPDDKSEDVFFHISKWKLPSQPILGQTVNFASKRNDKQQLSAINVTEYFAGTSQSKPGHERKPAKRNNQKKGMLSIISMLVLLAVAYFNFVDTKPSKISNSPQSNSSLSSSSINSKNTNISSITGDRQIDQTIALIQQNGPFPYPHKDGTIFYNREGKLPAKNRGYYREYTVPTPGVSHRGARRIVTGGKPPTFYYFTADHYASFKNWTWSKKMSQAIYYAKHSNTLPDQAINIPIGNVFIKATILSALAKACHFPHYFSHNWDSAYDCLTDGNVTQLKLCLANAKTVNHDDLKNFIRLIEDAYQEFGKPQLWIIMPLVDVP